MIMNIQRSNMGTFIAGAILIGFGALALLDQVFTDLRIWSFLWPFAVIGCGLLFFGGMLAGGKSMAGLAIPGAIITVSGLMLFFQNFTHLWSTWSYGWTVTIASIGLGIYIMGAYQEDEHRKRSGLKVMKIAAILFVVFGVLFEMVLSPNGLLHAPLAFPILLIVLGIYLVISRSGLLGPRKPVNDTSNPESPSQDIQ